MREVYLGAFPARLRRTSGVIGRGRLRAEQDEQRDSVCATDLLGFPRKAHGIEALTPVHRREKKRLDRLTIPFFSSDASSSSNWQ
jgi:hypothetical protein